MQVRFGQGLDFARFSTSVKNLIYRRLAPTIVLSLDFLSSFNSSPGPRPNNISSLHQINQGFFTQKKTKVSAEKPGAKEPPYPVESPSPPALPPCSARNAPASSSRPAGRTENPNVPRLALSTWSPRRGVVENIWRWATNLFMVWNGMIYEIYLGVECHIYATKLYATYMPHSYMGVGYVECICYISIDISKNWPASMVGWAPPRIVFPSGSCLPFSKCSAASYWIHVEAKLEADPKLNPWYFMILHHIRIINIYLSIFVSTQLRFPQFWPRCTWRHCVSDSRCCCVQCSLAASGVMRRMEFCFILAKVHELPSSCVLGLSCGSTSLRFFRDALKGLVLNWSRIGHELVMNWS